MLKKFLIGLGVIILLLLVAAAVGPRLVDWNSYKPRVIAAVRDSTGRELAIDGDISLRLLPSPTLSVAGVRLANLPGASTADMAQLKSLDVSVALMPLIHGAIQVTKVTLVDPVVLLEKLPDGRANWVFKPAGAAGAPALPQPGAPAASGSSPAISVDNFAIENGTIIYRSGATAERIEALNAAVSARSLKGPFTAAGEARAAGIPTKFSIAVGALDSGPAPLKLLINMAGDAAILQFDGTADQAASALKGKIDAKVADPGLLLKIAGITGLPPALTRPFMLASSIDASAEAVSLPDIAVALGDDKASGKVAVRLGSPIQAEASLAFGRLDLDKLISSSAPAAAAQAPAATAPGNAAPAVPSAGAPGFALPSGVVAAFDLSAEAVILRGGAIDHPRLAGRLADGRLELKQLSAQLPGGSDVSLVGAVAGKEGQPQFTGTLQAKSGDPRALAAWLGAGLPPLSGDGLRSLSLTSRLAASPRQAELADLDVRLDATRIRGGVNVALPDGTTRLKPGFGIGLTLDQIDLDRYMPAKAAPAKAGGTTGAGPAGAPAPAKGASPLASLAPLAGVDANFDLRAGALTLNGQAVRGLHLQGTIFNGRLAIADASVKDIGGGQGAISGDIVDLARDPRYDLKLDLGAPDAAQVFKLAGLARGTASGLGALKANGALKGGSDDVAFDLAFALTGVGVQGAAKGQARGLKNGPPKIDSTLNASAKDPGPLLQLFGLPADAAARLGSLALAGKASSGPDSVDYDVSLDLPGIGGKGGFQGKVTSLSKGPRLATNLRLDVAQPGPLLALAGINAPGADKLGAISLAGTANTGPDTVDYDLALDMPGMGGKGALKGKVTSLAGTPQVASDIKLDVARPAPLLALLGAGGAKAGNLGALALDGRLDGGTDAMKLNLSLSALGGTANVQGKVAAARPPIAFDLTLSASHPNGAALMSAFTTTGAAGQGNPGPLKLNGHIAGDTRKFTFNNLAAQLGGTDLSGSGTVGLGPRPSLQGSFASNNFNLAAFTGTPGGGQGGPMPGGPVQGGQPQAGQPAGGQVRGGPVAAGQAGGGHWSRQPLDLSALDKADAVLDYKAGHFLAGDTRIDNLVAKINLAAGTLALETLTGNVYGGSFAVQNGRVVGRGTPSFSGRLITQNLELSQLAKSGSVKGPVSVNADLAGRGASEADIVGSLQGRGKLAGRVTVLGKLEQTAGAALLNALGKQLSAVRGVTGALSTVVDLFVGRSNDVVGDFAIDHGVVSTENVTATNPQAKALFHGKVFLPPWTMAMLVDIYQLPQTAKPAMTVNLQGPVDRPNVGISGMALQPSQGGNPVQQLLQGVQPQQPSASGGGGSAGGGSGGTKVDPLAPLLQQLLGGKKTTP